MVQHQLPLHARDYRTDATTTYSALCQREVPAGSAKMSATPRVGASCSNHATLGSMSGVWRRMKEDGLSPGMPEGVAKAAEAGGKPAWQDCSQQGCLGTCSRCRVRSVLSEGLKGYEGRRAQPRDARGCCKRCRSRRQACSAERCPARLWGVLGLVCQGAQRWVCASWHRAWFSSWGTWQEFGGASR